MIAAYRPPLMTVAWVGWNAPPAAFSSPAPLSKVFCNVLHKVNPIIISSTASCV